MNSSCAALKGSWPVKTDPESGHPMILDNTMRMPLTPRARRRPSTWGFGIQHTIIFALIVARTLMAVPRMGTAPLGAAASASAMEGWPEPLGTIAHAVVNFAFTDVLLAIFLWKHVARLQGENLFLALAMCLCWTAWSFNGQPEVIAYWRRSRAQQHAMDILVSVIQKSNPDTLY